MLRSFFLLFVPSFVFAQQRTIDVGKDNVSPVRDGLFYTVAGTPFSPYKYVRVVSGSPYFNDDWMKGVVLIPGGGRAKSDQVKLDLISGELLYKDSTEKEFIATTPVQQLVLTDPASGKEYVFVNSSFLDLPGKEAAPGWYQLLEPGTATLYKKIKKTISESRPFNSATTEQTINTTNQYLLAFNRLLTVVKKPKDIPAVLTDKKVQLDQYIGSNKFNGKTDTDFSSVIAYYNSLAAK